MSGRPLLVAVVLMATVLSACVAAPDTQVPEDAQAPFPDSRPDPTPATQPPPEPGPEPAPEHEEEPEPEGQETSPPGSTTPSPSGQPVARVEAETPHLILGDALRLDGRTSEDPHGRGLTYHWDLGDGTTSGKPTLEHTYGREGSFTVRLTVTDAEGRSHRSTLPVTVESTVYEQGVWFTWQTTELDILILGVEDPLVGAAIAHAIKAWEEGIADLSPELGERLEFRLHWADDGVPPNLNPHILFVPQGFFAVSTAPCIATAPLTHEAVSWSNAQYRVAAHEFGHCLGLTHVFEDGVEYEPGSDLMGGGRADRSCPSNLNVQVLEMVFSGQRGAVRMPPAAYHQGEC